MNIIGINGSPRKNGNTLFLLEKSLNVAKNKGFNIEIINAYSTLKSLKIPFCIHWSNPCNRSCYTGSQLEKDFEKLSKADGIILASPVYFGSVSAQLKAFWDKTRALRSDFALVGKIGSAISVGASPYGGQETTIRTLQDMMFIQGMTIVGNGLMNINVGHQGACARQPVFENKKVIENVENMGLRVANEILARKH